MLDKVHNNMEIKCYHEIIQNLLVKFNFMARQRSQLRIGKISALIKYICSDGW